ncbi:hypothetical protein HY495_03540 [Candidatus Woesearchaeota archaeon]|nr:hypothetical protein [Candidatus Woesearchaeota archaeon]
MGKRKLTPNTWNGGSYRKTTRPVPHQDLSETPSEPSPQERYNSLLAECNREVAKAEKKWEKYTAHGWRTSGIQKPEQVRDRYAPRLQEISARYTQPCAVQTVAEYPAAPSTLEAVTADYIEPTSKVSQYVDSQRKRVALLGIAVSELERTLVEKKAELEKTPAKVTRLEKMYQQFQELCVPSDTDLTIASCNERLTPKDLEMVTSMHGGLTRATTEKDYFRF